MRNRGVVAVRVLVLVLTAAVLAGCSAEMNRVKGQNQSLIKQREDLTKENQDLKALLAQDELQSKELEIQLKQLQADVDYWKGQAGAYSDAYEKRRGMGELSFPEKLMQEIAQKINAEYVPGGGIRLASDILFDSGRATLKQQAKESLKKVSEALTTEQARDLYLRVDGHTDSQPIKYSGWKDNMELSQARARAVWLELKGTGTAAERMFTAGFGEYRPIDTNSTAAGKARNRRVELFVVPAPSSQVQAESGQPEETETKKPVEEVFEPTK